MSEWTSARIANHLRSINDNLWLTRWAGCSRHPRERCRIRVCPEGVGTRGHCPLTWPRAPDRKEVGSEGLTRLILLKRSRQGPRSYLDHGLKLWGHVVKAWGFKMLPRQNKVILKGYHGASGRYLTCWTLSPLRNIDAGVDTVIRHLQDMRHTPSPSNQARNVCSRCSP